MISAKGSTLRSTLAFIRQELGADAEGRVLGRLAEEERARILSAEPTDEVAFELLLALWRAADAELAPTHPQWVEQAGAFSIDSLGVQLYGGILRKASPREFLTQPISLFRLYYQPGNMEVVEEEPGRAVLRLVGIEAGERLFCRRQTGGLLRAVELAGGGTASARHTRCTVDGDAFCEWQLAWQ